MSVNVDLEELDALNFCAVDWFSLYWFPALEHISRAEMADLFEDRTVAAICFVPANYAEWDHNELWNNYLKNEKKFFPEKRVHITHGQPYIFYTPAIGGVGRRALRTANVREYFKNGDIKNKLYIYCIASSYADTLSRRAHSSSNDTEHAVSAYTQYKATVSYLIKTLFMFRKFQNINPGIIFV